MEEAKRAGGDYWLRSEVPDDDDDDDNDDADHEVVVVVDDVVGHPGSRVRGFECDHRGK